MAIKYDVFREWLPSITDGSKPYLYGKDVTLEPFMLLRALSHFEDCLPYSNLANEKMNGKIDGKLLYDFLFYGIQKKKRWGGKWGKMEKESADLELIKRAFGCNKNIAKDYLRILEKNGELENLRRDYDEGGRK